MTQRKNYFIFLSVFFLLTLIFFGVTTQVNADITSGLVGHWEFDEGSGTTAEDSEGSNDGILTNGPTWTTGQIGSGALQFDGVDDRVNVGSANAYEGAGIATFSIWVKHRTGTSNGSDLWSDYSGGGANVFEFGYSANETLNCKLLANSAGSISTGLTDTNWHHFACVYDGSNLILYLDGVQQGASPLVGNIQTTTSNLLIGAGDSGSGFDGSLDDARIYDRALSSSDIEELYELASGGGGSYSTPYASPYAYQTPADTTNPVISNITVSNITNNGATISWNTDESTESEVQYGITTSYGSILNSNSTTTHSVNLTGLLSETQYNYRIHAEDPSSNTANSANTTFTTLSDSYTTPYATPYVTPAYPTPTGSITYYVDQNHVNASDTNSGTSEVLPFRTIQKAATIVNPGDTVLIKAGLYQHTLSTCTGAVCRFVYVTRSGTDGNPITFKAFGNGTVTLRGYGFEDRDLNSDGNADGPLNPSKRENLIYVLADYIHIEDLELTNSGGGGIVVQGSHNLVENVHTHNNWASGLTMGDNTLDLLTADNVIKNLESHNNRHGNGIAIAVPVDGMQPITRNRFVDNLTYANGREANGTRVLRLNSDPAGGGNSDGYGASKNCADGPAFNPSLTIPNLCPNNVWQGNVSWLNTDDGADVSVADSLFIDNINFGNGGAAGGGKGFKVLRDVNNLAFVGNIVYANVSRGMEPRVTEGGVFLNNLIITNGSQGLLSIGSNATARNNMGYGNTGTDISITTPCANCSNNWIGNVSGTYTGNPLLTNLTPFKDAQGNITVNFPSGLSIDEKVSWIKNEFKNAFALQAGSLARDAGVFVSYVDPITNQTLTRSYNGGAPDLGAYEYNSGSYPTPAYLTPPPTDTTPPVISSVSFSSISQTGATITWTTNESSDTQVDYGTTTSYGSSSTLNTSMLTSHSVILTGLTAGTTYNYRVKSSDALSNLATSANFTFTTTAAADTTPPSAITNLSNASTGQNSTVLSFTAPGNNGTTGTASSYDIRYSTATINSTNFTSATIVTGEPTPQVAGTNQTYTLVGLTAGTTYYVAMRTSDVAGNISAISNVINFTTTAASAYSTPYSYPYPTPSTYPTPAYATPSTGGGGGSSTPTFNVSVEALSQQVSLTWARPTNASFVRMLVIRKASTAPRNFTDGTPIYEGTALNFTDTKLTNGTTYHYALFPITLSGTATSPLRVVSATPLAGLTQVSTTRTATAATATTTPSTPTSGGSNGPNIIRTLIVGTRGEDVTALQNHLISLGYLTTGNNTGYFGPLTKAAVQKYQCANNIICTGTESTTGYGAVGPRTRIALKGTITPSTGSTPSTSSPQASSGLPVLTRDLSLGSRGTDVTSLQNYLIEKQYLAPSNNTGYFGPLTRAAVIKFQIANNITPALGYFGVKSRGVIK